MSFNEKLGKLLRDSREGKHLTREKLAEMCNVSDRCISNIERGVSEPKITTVVKLAKALEIDSNVIEEVFKDIELNVVP